MKNKKQRDSSVELMSKQLLAFFRGNLCAFMKCVNFENELENLGLSIIN